MSVSAIAMMVFGLVVTWGGALICLRIALKSRSK
ncbi:MAG: MetS family NSS transporter small subunit [Desulfovibrionaceae bacterium]